MLSTKVTVFFKMKMLPKNNRCDKYVTLERPYVTSIVTKTKSTYGTCVKYVARKTLCDLLGHNEGHIESF
jgi:hypothetical protein